MITSLDVGLWPMISWSAQNIHRLHLVHLDSSLNPAPARSGLWSGACGRSVWSGMCSDGLVGVSWPWAQLKPGVFALMDPLAVKSNLHWLASDGSPLSVTAAMMVHGRLIRTLDWQPEAARAAIQHRTRRIDAVQTRAAAYAS